MTEQPGASIVMQTVDCINEDSASSEKRRPVAAIVMAAGRSTRMRSKTPKSLHPLCGLAMTAHVLRACRAAGVERLVVVVGYQAETVQQGLGDDCEYVLQVQQRGTGDAVRAAEPLLADWQGTIIVLAGDVPLLTASTLRALATQQQATQAGVAMATATLEVPTGYGRIIRDGMGRVLEIVEERDASAEQRAIREVNPSIYAFDAQALWKALSEIRPDNAQGEFYLTDTVGVLAKQGAAIDTLPVPDYREVLGVNTRVELAAAAAVLRERLLIDLMLSGVTVTDPSTTYVDVDVTVGQDTVIEPHTILLRGTQVGEDCVLGPFTRIEQSQLGHGVRVVASHVEESIVHDNVKIGPYAHLRPGAVLGAKVKIGNFVEIKNSTLHTGSQASHLAYIGDAEIGSQTNIGAGTITCNYDGFRKYRTTIGNGAFIGSNSTLVAPVSIHDGAFVAAGSTITTDVPQNALGIARMKPTIKEGWATAFRARSGSAKAVVAEVVANGSEADSKVDAEIETKGKD